MKNTFFDTRRTLLAGALLSTGALLGACGDSGAATRPAPAKVQAPAVQVMSIEQRMLSNLLHLDGEVVSLSAPQLSAEVAGQLREVLVKPGDSVRAGQLLARIDNHDQTLALQEARARSTEAQATHELRTSELNRARSLFEKEYISRAERDSAVHAAALAEQGLASARAQLARQSQSLGRTEVRAPAAGVITHTLADAGAYVRAGDPLFSFWRPGDASVVLKVDQSNLGQVLPGQHTLLTWQGRQATSEVLRVSPVVDPASRSFDVHVRVPEELSGSSGSAVRAELNLGSKSALLAPTLAVQRDARAQAYVFVVKDDMAKRVAIEAGALRAEGVEVLQGLSAGDVVVSQGAAFLNDGQAVRVSATDATKAEGDAR